MSQTWLTFKTKNDISKLLFEDPVYSTYTDGDTFVSIYGQALETFDGLDECSYFDFYFELSPVNQTIYLFRDSDAKLDFRDLAIDLELIPKIQEIMEAETAEQKIKRNNCCQKQQQKKIITLETKQKHRQEQTLKTLDNLMKKLKLESDPIIRRKIEIKIKNMLNYLNKTQ
jgi:hypothetical protein